MCCPCVGVSGLADLIRKANDQGNEGSRGMKHSISVHVGKMVRQRRWMVGMTLQQLGDRVGITARQIMEVEAGTYEIDASLMRDIAAALEVSALLFFEGIDPALGDVA